METKVDWELVYRPVTGLKIPKDVPAEGTKKILPSGKSRLPKKAVDGVLATLPNTGVAEVAHQLRAGCEEALDAADIHA